MKGLDKNIVLFISVGFITLIALTLFFLHLNKIDLGGDDVVACDKLPSLEYVQRTLDEQKAAVEQVESIRLGYIWMSFDDTRCFGRAEILIYYATESDRKKIKKLIGSTFFTIPYRMFNV